ncbi:mnmA, partial [Symbiodinium microadriaticum]
VSFIREYWNNVFVPFIECYESGEGTPNPDVSCNSYIKFSSLRDHVINKLGFDMMATGHYARLENVSCDSTGVTLPQLKRGVDPTKDQSYFLCMTENKCFENIMFPLGEMTKAQVKEIALSSELLVDLNVLTKKESMGVCFI